MRPTIRHFAWNGGSSTWEVTVCMRVYREKEVENGRGNVCHKDYTLYTSSVYLVILKRFWLVLICQNTVFFSRFDVIQNSLRKSKQNDKHHVREALPLFSIV